MDKQEKKQKAKRPWLKWALICFGGAIVLVVLAVFIMGSSLLGRLAKPGTVTFAEAAEETPPPAATATPIPAATATPLPGQTPEPTPELTPEPTDEPELPLSELYPQTRLTDAQKALMASLNEDPQYLNVLLVGVDRRGRAGNSQADAIMIATLDKKNGRLKLTSLLRDLWVDIPGFGDFRINSAAAKGGMDLLMDTINANYSMNISRYVLVDFSMFEKIVDEMGGITIRMTGAEISAANDCIAGLNKQRNVEYLWDGFIFAEAGNVKCTGKQALGYARIRKIDSDFVRTNRQFKVLTAIFAKFRSKSLTQQYSIMNDILPLVETNLGGGEIIDAAISALSMDTGGILHESLPVEGLYRSARVKGSSVLVSDLPAHAWLLHQFIYFSDDVPGEAKELSPGASLPPRTPSPTLDPAAQIINPDDPLALVVTPDGGIASPTAPAEPPPAPVEPPPAPVPEDPNG